jgi:hypothetical protein
MSQCFEQGSHFGGTDFSIVIHALAEYPSCPADSGNLELDPKSWTL